MREPDTDMLDHLGTMREEKNEPSCFECDLAFAFNNTNFSYRLLTIEVMPDPHFIHTQSHSLPTIANWTRNSKRRRQRVRKHFANANDVLLHREEQVNCNLPEAEEAVGMIEGSPSGDEVFHGNDSSLGMSWSKVLGVRIMHISSPILAAKSPFFYKVNEALNLPLAGIEAVLSSDDLQTPDASSEGCCQDRHDVLGSHLG